MEKRERRLRFAQAKVYEYRIFGAKSIISKIRPLFDQFCLKTRPREARDYSDFRKIAFLIQARPQRNWSIGAQRAPQSSKQYAHQPNE
jgi:hypothetical protein